MPYYNNQDVFFDNSINGILQQTVQNWHLYIIDDGSVLEKKPNVELLKHSNSRFTIITKENGGPSSARNAALDMIKDKNYHYVAFCDADDCWMPNHLELHVPYLQDYDMVYSEPICVFESGQIAYKQAIQHFDYHPDNSALHHGNFIYISSVIVKSDKILPYRFDSELDSIEDWDMWLNLVDSNCVMYKNTINTIYYIVKNSSNSAANCNQSKIDKCKMKHNIGI